MIQWALGTNGVFHVATTLLFREYSPGVVTGAGLYLPFTVYFLHRVLADRHLTTAQAAAGCLAGTAVSALWIASLWLDMDFV
jgi:hypothetical protein